MGLQTKTIGRQPTDHGIYDPNVAYGKKFIVTLYDCGWESKHDNNTTAPATLNTQTGTITPNTTDWIKRWGSYEQWLIDNGYKKMDASHVKDNTLNKPQNEINASIVGEIGADSASGTIKGRIKSLENSVGTGGSVDQRIDAAENEIIGGASSSGNTLKKVEDRTATLESAVGNGGSVDTRISNAVAVETTRAQAAEADRYTKSETYTKAEVNGLVDTPHQEYVTVATYASLPALGSKDTIYRVSNYDGSQSQVDNTVYSEYAWDGTQYVFLCVKSQIGEVFDISVYNNNAKYADLAAALNGGANIPQSLQKGGMSVKFVQSSDNKYVQYRLKSQNWDASPVAWESTTYLEKSFNSIFDSVPSINLFDGDFDEYGYIDTITGADMSSASYKRTSKYYPITNDTGFNSLTMRVSTLVPTFVVVLYDSTSDTPIANEPCSGTLVNQVEIPSTATRFRVYTDASFSGESYISMVYSTVVIPYGNHYEYKDNSIEYGKLNDAIKNKYNLVGSIIDNKYLKNTSGETYDVNDYRTSDFIKIEPNTKYKVGMFNSSFAPSIETLPITVCFYTSNTENSYISGTYVYSSGYDPVNCTWEDGLVTFTTPSTARYARIGTRDSEEPFNWFFAKYTDPSLYVIPNSIKQDMIGLNINLQGKHVAVFGDSIIGNTRDNTSTPSYISKFTGATVYNFGFGGCRMSVHVREWDLCSMYRLADDIYNESFSDLEAAVSGSGWSGMPGYFSNTVAWLSACDFSKVDAIIISYGTNDYREETSVLDNPNNKFDTSTVCGALRYSIKQILSKYPKIQILVTCPIFRTFFEEGTTTPEEYSDTKDWGSGTLIQYAEAYKQACADMNVPFLDLYHKTSFNPYTRLYFYPTDDGTHPNEKGRERIGKIVGGKLISLLP